MARTWFKYWKPEQIRSSLSDGLLHHLASGQLKRVSSGDRIWVVSARPGGDLVTVGNLIVNNVISMAEAKRVLPYRPWAAKYHVAIPKSQAVPTREVSLKSILRRLRFDSKADRLNLTGGRGIGRQLQTMRILTPATAQLVSQVWDESEEELAAVEAELDRIEAGDIPRMGKWRKEQQKLRKARFGDREEDACDICGRTLPVSLLVAAHIKTRKECSATEKGVGLKNIAAMCVLGCDALFERRWLIVRSGRIVLRLPSGTPHLRKAFATLKGRKVVKSTGASASFFRWHAAQPPKPL